MIEKQVKTKQNKTKSRMIQLQASTLGAALEGVHETAMLKAPVSFIKI